MDIRGWWRRLHDCLPARVCCLCGAPGLDGLDLCGACLADFPFNHSCCACCGLPTAVALPRCGRCQRRPPAWHQTWAPFRYEWPLAPLETRFKFGADLAAGQLLGSLWARQPRPQELPEALIAVPLHRSRLRQRGYNQAWELARILSRQLGVPLLASGLRRSRATEPQTGLGALQRRRNLQGAFVANLKKGTWPAHLALVDDVMTTGATLQACSEVLCRAGVGRVDVWVLARAAASF
ncbi:ComF family protein [Frateuria aurantia]